MIRKLIYKHKEKGAAEIISVILIILVAVVLTMIFLAWSKNSVKNNLENSQKVNTISDDISCIDSSLKIESCDINSSSNEFTFIISNNTLIDYYGIKLTIFGKDIDNLDMKLVGSIIPTIEKGQIILVSTADAEKFQYTNLDRLVADFNANTVSSILLTSLTCPKQYINIDTCDINS
ncbi:MAG: hypothetical protein V1824_00860 [archaeon]